MTTNRSRISSNDIIIPKPLINRLSQHHSSYYNSSALPSIQPLSLLLSSPASWKSRVLSATGSLARSISRWRGAITLAGKPTTSAVAVTFWDAAAAAAAAALPHMKMLQRLAAAGSVSSLARETDRRASNAILAIAGSHWVQWTTTTTT